jgi:hypothetical protein
MSALRGRNTKPLGLALVMLVIAVGFCLFDGDDGDGHAGLDLCLGMLAASPTLTLISRLPLTGSTSTDRLSGILEFTPLVPAPPPKPALS